MTQIKSDINKIKENLKTQDNRITDQPMFIVEQEVKIGPFLDGYGDFYEWFNHELIEVASGHLLKRLEQRIEAGADPREPFQGWERHSMKKGWKFVTACFTEQGCKDYIAFNGHNLNKTRIYAVSSYRNTEYQTIRNWILNGA